MFAIPSFSFPSTIPSTPPTPNENVSTSQTAIPYSLYSTILHQAVAMPKREFPSSLWQTVVPSLSNKTPRAPCKLVRSTWPQTRVLSAPARSSQMPSAPECPCQWFAFYSAIKHVVSTVPYLVKHWECRSSLIGGWLVRLSSESRAFLTAFSINVSVIHLQCNKVS